MNPRLRSATPLAIKRPPAVGSPTDPDGGAGPSLLPGEDQTEVAAFAPAGESTAAAGGRPRRDLLVRKAVGSLLIVTASFFVGAALFGPPVGPPSPIPPETVAPPVPPAPPVPAAVAAPAEGDVLLTVTVPPSGATPARRRPRRPRRPAPAAVPALSDAPPTDRRPIESRNPYADDLP
jgi:hypothetical protein